MSPQKTYQQRMAEFQRASERVRFYKSVGRPELAQRYEPFAIPKGMKVREIQETKQGLKVSFYDPSVQEPQASVPQEPSVSDVTFYDPSVQEPQASVPQEPSVSGQGALERQRFYKC